MICRFVIFLKLFLDLFEKQNVTITYTSLQETKLDMNEYCFYGKSINLF